MELYYCFGVRGHATPWLLPMTVTVVTVPEAKEKNQKQVTILCDNVIVKEKMTHKVITQLRVGNGIDPEKCLLMNMYKL